MPKSKRIKQYSADELRSMLARGGDQSDLARVKAMSEKELEAAIASDPDSDPDVDWSQMTVTLPKNKHGVYLRLDPDVLKYFKSQGAGYQTRINAVLRSYVEQMSSVPNKKRA
jgi:uncharacterized protein (DUF4415 family)